MSRITALQNLLAKEPGDAMTRYMLANELYKDGQFAEAASELEEYLKNVEDEGAAYRTLADAYRKIGKKKEAQWALRQGAQAARVHHHEGMAEEFEEKLKEI
ncbi:MAG: tetratricopeptide repeat protein [Acidobacteriota bacterium]|nr:MAG: tetratricopeptide repeat protein [Acidobacteriota bacterium]